MVYSVDTGTDGESTPIQMKQNLPSPFLSSVSDLIYLSVATL